MDTRAFNWRMPASGLHTARRGNWTLAVLVVAYDPARWTPAASYGPLRWELNYRGAKVTEGHSDLLDDARRAAEAAYRQQEPLMVAAEFQSINTPQMSTDITTRLGAELRRAREAAGLTQAEAAELAGVTPGRWSQMEGGATSNLNKLLAACVAIGAVLNIEVTTPKE
jgi:DNA-binding XRE family transcriptional regulator